MKKHIPNTITCCNLISGCIATYFAFKGEYSTALTFIIVGAIFDFFDGFAARLLKVSSPIGKELDSLADVITFGFAPAAFIFSKLGFYFTAESGELLVHVPCLAFLVAAFSALRLAKFNLDERQTMGFIGLPTPANALFWGTLIVSLPDSFSTVSWLPYALIGGIFISCYLLVSEIPMFALKFKSFAWKENELRYVFILLSAVLIAILGLAAFVIIIPLYIIVSVINNKFSKQ